MEDFWLNFAAKFCTNQCSNLIAFFGLLCSAGLFWIAYSARDSWLKQIKAEKFETAKNNLVIALIDVFSTLSIHCNLDLSVSCDTEQNNPDIYKSKDRSQWQLEMCKIDIEITNKLRKLDESIKSFEFYINDSEIISQLKKYQKQLNDFAQEVYMMISEKYSCYLESTEELRNTFGKSLDNCRKKLKEITSEHNKIIERLKNNEYGKNIEEKLCDLNRDRK